MKEWKLLAAGLRLDIPDEDLRRAAAAMEAVEAAFRPLVSDIPFLTEPAYVALRFPEEE